MSAATRVSIASHLCDRSDGEFCCLLFSLSLKSLKHPVCSVEPGNLVIVPKAGRFIAKLNQLNVFKNQISFFLAKISGLTKIFQSIDSE